MRSQTPGPSQRDPGRPAAPLPLRARRRHERPSVGQVGQHPADAHHRQPAAELRDHDGGAEEAAVREGGTGGAIGCTHVWMVQDGSLLD